MTHKGEIKQELYGLEKLLTERIADLHNIKGLASERHALILYRDRVFKVQSLVESSYKTKVC